MSTFARLIMHELRWTLRGGLPPVAHARGGRRRAEGEGFEPPEPFRVQWFSRPPPSTTRPSLRVEISPESARLLADQGVGRPRVTRSVTIGRTPDDTPQRIVAARRSVVLAF